MTYHYGQISQHDCLYTAARAYPGGIEALAQRMGTSAGVLYKKLSPGVSSHYPSYEEATVVMELCRGAGVPEALSAHDAQSFRLGKICIDIPHTDEGDIDVEEIQRLVFKAVSQLGAAVAASTDALVDGHLSEQEMRDIEPKLRALLPTIAGWLQRMKTKSKSDAGKVISKIMRRPHKEAA
jgi:hypothetical protein